MTMRHLKEMTFMLRENATVGIDIRQSLQVDY